MPTIKRVPKGLDSPPKYTSTTARFQGIVDFPRAFLLELGIHNPLTRTPPLRRNTRRATGRSSTNLLALGRLALLLG